MTIYAIALIPYLAITLLLVELILTTPGHEDE